MKVWIRVASAILAVLLMPSTRSADIPSGEHSFTNFAIDSAWPAASLKLGMVTGLDVDNQDHVWILHRASLAAESEGVAPAVIELDEKGRMVRGWGSPGSGYDWPAPGHEHGIFVDYRNNVWIGAEDREGKTENQMLKFTPDGQFLLQIGRRGRSSGSNDVESLGSAANVYVDPKTNEAYIADGYVNRRVIVFDAGTGKFKLYWGAYGRRPDDSAKPGDPSQFTIVHQTRVSSDGLVYVASRQNSRIQVFTRGGKFIKERILKESSPESPGVVSIAFSRDPAQSVLYVLDLTRSVVHILNRRTLASIGSLGGPGPGTGQFQLPHNCATDSQGNLYVAELGQRVGAKWNGRIQKFTLLKDGTSK